MDQKISQIIFDVVQNTPVGSVWVAVSELGLVAVQIGGDRDAFPRWLAARFGVPVFHHKPRIAKIISQIQEYLQGERKTFDTKIHWGIMSEFQQKSLKAVCRIPYGETRTYGQIAAEIGVPQAPRAVGRANATNPMPLVIPCHRLVGADDSLRGYGGGEGIKTKDWLLTLERSHV
jgi:methylated-DNA-[protein]-cysteine S-methyltransferase